MPVAEIIDPADLLEACNRAAVYGFTEADRADAIDTATDRIRQAAYNEYTPASFESLTLANRPKDFRDHGVALALGILTKNDAGRADSIGAAYNEASKWLGFIVGGKTHYDQEPGAVLVKHQADSDGVSYQVPAKKFDRSSNDYYGVPRR